MSTRPATNYVRMQRPSPVATRGFTLIEVMVALIIIAIGTLGLAKMQALALASTGASRSRALVAVEATSLAEAMHANHLYWSTSTSAPGTVTITTSGGTTAPTFVTTGSLQTALNSAGASLCATSTTMTASLSCLCTTGVSAPCTGTYVNMAASDLYDWGQGLASLLPNATATVSCNTGDSPIDCTIAITWTENAVALNTQEASAVNGNANTGASTTAAFQYVTYSLYVVP